MRPLKIENPGELFTAAEFPPPALPSPPPAPAPQTACPEKDSAPLAALRLGSVKSDELQSMELPKHPLVLGDWFADADLGFIFAQRGVGKTWFAMAVARALAEGKPLGPWAIPSQIPVMYVDGEMNAEQIKARDAGLKRAAAEIIYVNHEILFQRTEQSINLCLPDWQSALTQACVETGRRVLFLDNLSCLFRGMSENKNDEWEMVLPWLLTLRRRGIAVVIVHHCGRSSQEMRGGSRREDAAAWTIRLDDTLDGVSEKAGARFVSVFSKPSRHTPTEVPRLEWEFRTDTSTGLTEARTKPASHLHVLRQHVEDGLDNCTDIAEAMKLATSQVSKLAMKAIREGWLEKQGRNYKLAGGAA